jgi:uncharacterized protein YukE
MRLTAIEQLKKARSIETVAEQIEPLAQAMAALTDETAETLERIKAETATQVQQWQRQAVQLKAENEAAASKLHNLIELAQKLTRFWTLKAWAAVVLVALLAAAPSAYVIWRHVPGPAEIKALEKEVQTWRDFVATFHALPKARQEAVKQAMGWQSAQQRP